MSCSSLVSERGARLHEMESKHLSNLTVSRLRDECVADFLALKSIVEPHLNGVKGCDKHDDAECHVIDGHR